MDRGDLLTRWKQWWRQRKVPREWRIGPPLWPIWCWDFLEKLEKLFQDSKEPPRLLSKPEAEAPSADWIPFRRESAALLGTHVFQMQEVDHLRQRRASEETIRSFCYHVKRLREVLTEAGLKIHDHTGERVPESGSCELRIAAFQPTAGVAQPVVLETIKPSIWYESQLIQRGEVIVAVPPDSPGG